MRQPEQPLKVLIVGSGGREHVLASLCRKSPFCREVIAAPGNGGMAAEIPCHPVAADDVDGLVDLAVREKVDFVVVGPEAPLSLGLVDALATRNIAAYGPEQAGARLEASKDFCKRLLLNHQIPTAAARTFDEVDPALDDLRSRTYPVVIKADGLAAGKGVIIAENFDQAAETVQRMLRDKAFGESGSRLLIEDYLQGEEASIHLMVSGRDFVVLPTSQDHKRVGENDIGPNTGGMGAYSPADLVEPLLPEIIETIARPSVEAIANEGISFRGTLYIGLMLTEQGPKVLEFNTRFGDPETQVILPRLETDVLHLMHACAHGYLAEVPLQVADKYALCVVLTAGGYPGAYNKGDKITLPEGPLPAEAAIYHAGTKLSDDGTLVTNGGRVLGVTAVAPSLQDAAATAYDLCAKIKFASMVYRRDIGAKQLNRQLSR